MIAAIGRLARLARVRARRLAHPEDVLLGTLPYVVFAVLFGWLAVLQPKSLSYQQFSQIVSIELVPILLAVGETIVVLTGGIDLSIGGILSLTNAIAASAMSTRAEMLWVGALLVAFGWLPGAVNGLLIVYGQVQPFIATLATWFIWGGMAFLVLPVTGGQVDQDLGRLSTGSVAGIANPMWMLLGVVLFGLYFLRTRLGLTIRALGSDRESAIQSGMRVTQATLAAYALSSWWAVVAGIVLTAQNLAGDPSVGDSYILPAVAAVVIGGTSLLGGAGTIVGSVVGALVLAYVSSVAFTLGLSSEWGVIASAFLLVFTVSLQLLVRVAFRSREEQ